VVFRGECVESWVWVSRGECVESNGECVVVSGARGFGDLVRDEIGDAVVCDPEYVFLGDLAGSFGEG
jgi:hypothetical protein